MAKKKDDNTTLYIAIGTGLAALAGVAFLATRRTTPNSTTNITNQAPKSTLELILGTVSDIGGSLINNLGNRNNNSPDVNDRFIDPVQPIETPPNLIIN